MIYEDVQRSGESGLIDNGWGSSEFESYDEQSDSETKQPTRNKVETHGLLILTQWGGAICLSDQFQVEGIVLVVFY